MGQLAIFNLIIGGSETLVLEDALPGVPAYLVYLTNTGEWTSMIAYGAKYIKVYPYIVIETGIAFVLLIVSLQFFLHQFKKRTR